MQNIVVEGMTCGGCEQRIENGLLKQSGIVSVSANYINGCVAIEYDAKQITLAQIEALLAELHYPALQKSVRQKGGLLKQWGITVLVLGGIVAVFLLLQQTGIFNLFPMAEKGTALPVLFLIGLLTSVHCIAMCGGINISQCANASTEGKKTAKLVPSLLYNAGRVVSYTVIGGVVGAIGAVVTPSGGFKGVVAIVAGAFMLVMGMNMLNLFPALRRFIPRLPKSFARKVNQEKAGKGPFIVGLLNGFMPCGPLQAMQLYALSTGSFLLGALSMFLFSLGTVPLMFGLGALSALLSARFTGVMMRVSAVLVLLLGLMMLNSGLSLSGFNPLF